MHPRALGFTKEIVFSLDGDGNLSRVIVSSAAREQQDLLYVAWLSPMGRALKIGLSQKSLWARWTNVVRNMERPLEALPFLRPNEIRDREKLRDFSIGQTIEVWMTPYPAPRDREFARLTTGMTLKEAERLLDVRYAPLFGRPLGPREPWVAVG